MSSPRILLVDATPQMAWFLRRARVPHAVAATVESATELVLAGEEFDAVLVAARDAARLTASLGDALADRVIGLIDDRPSAEDLEWARCAEHHWTVRPTSTGQLRALLQVVVP